MQTRVLDREECGHTDGEHENVFILAKLTRETTYIVTIDNEVFFNVQVAQIADAYGFRTGVHDFILVELTELPVAKFPAMIHLLAGIAMV